MKILDFSTIPSRHFLEWGMQEITVKDWASHDRSVKRILLFNPMEWDEQKFHYFIALLKEKYTYELANCRKAKELVSVPNVSKSRTLGVAISSALTKHQAFIFVLALIGVLIALSIILILIVSKT